MAEFLASNNLTLPVVVFGGIGGSLWVMAYILYIRRGFLDATYGIPAFAIIGNFAWELQFTFLVPLNILQLIVNGTWFVLDLFIVYQVVRWGAPEFVRFSGLPRWTFIPFFMLAFTMLFMLFLTISIDTNDLYGHYGSYTLNLYMSILFSHRLLQKQSAAGQSVYAGLGRMFGTSIYALAALEFFGFSPYLTTLFVSIFIWDAIYILLLIRQLIAEGLNPWRRF